jgi:hypothetical protein
VKQLFKAREEMIDFLFRVIEREKVLNEMKQAVMSIKSEKDIEEELVNQ